MTTHRNLGALSLVLLTMSLGFACKPKTEQTNTVPEQTANPNAKHDDETPKEKSASDEGWEPVPVGGVGGGPSDEATPAPPVAKPANTGKPKSTTPAPKPSTSAPPGWKLPAPPSAFPWPSAWPSGWAFPAPSSAPPPGPSATPSGNSGGWNVGQ